MTGRRLDRVLTFDDKLSFLIPHEWVESLEEDGTYLYHVDGTDSGWFRVSLITLSQPGKASREDLLALLQERAEEKKGNLYVAGENIVAAWKQQSEEAGKAILNYWFAVGHSFGANLAREALFSYTILRERRETPENQETVKLLFTLVAQAQFSDPSVQ